MKDTERKDSKITKLTDYFNSEFEEDDEELEDDDEELEEERKPGYPMNGLRVCVDQYDGDMKGRFYSKMSAKALRFRDLSEFLLRADTLFDMKGYPQNFLEKRTFAEKAEWTGRYQPPEAVRGDEDVLSQRGLYCTFDVIVSSRRRASWQGLLINRVRPGKYFDSAKELLQIMIAAADKERKDIQGKS